MTQSREVKGTVKKEKCWCVECSARTNGKVELTLGTGKNAIKKYYSSYDEMYEDNPEYSEDFYKFTSSYIELTPLELILFEQYKNTLEAHKKAYNLYNETGEFDYGFISSLEVGKSDMLEFIISSAKLFDKYQSWEKERNKNDTVKRS